jgi:hypothetical protein
MLLDLVVVAGGVERSRAMFESFSGTWLPFALVFLATWGTGSLMSTMPRTKERGAKETAASSRNQRRRR